MLLLCCSSTITLPQLHVDLSHNTVLPELIPMGFPWAAALPAPPQHSSVPQGPPFKHCPTWSPWVAAPTALLPHRCPSLWAAALAQAAPVEVVMGCASSSPHPPLSCVLLHGSICAVPRWCFPWMRFPRAHSYCSWCSSGSSVSLWNGCTCSALTWGTAGLCSQKPPTKPSATKPLPSKPNTVIRFYVSYPLLSYPSTRSTIVCFYVCGE